MTDTARTRAEAELREWVGALYDNLLDDTGLEDRQRDRQVGDLCQIIEARVEQERVAQRTADIEVVETLRRKCVNLKDDDGNEFSPAMEYSGYAYRVLDDVLTALRAQQKQVKS